MKKWIPFFKSYTEICPDGRRKTIFKNIEDAFPFYIQGFEANISSDLRAELFSLGSIDGKLKSKVEGLLYGLDDINNDLMMSFRSVYIGFQSDPCSNSDFLLLQIEKIIDEQRRLRKLKLKIVGYIELARNHPNEVSKLAEYYADLVNSIGSEKLDGLGVSEAIKSTAVAVKTIME